MNKRALRRAFKAREFLASQLEAGDKPRGLNNYGLVRTDGEIKFLPGQPCYGGIGYQLREFLGQAGLKDFGLDLNDYKTWKGHKLDAFFDCVGPAWKRRKFTDMDREYLTFVANNSLFRHCIVTKDAEEILTCGTIFDTNFPPAYIMAAGMAIRYIREYPGVINTFCQLREHVDNQNLALLLSNYLNLHRNGQGFTWIGIRGHQFLCGYGHTAMTDRLQIKAMMHEDFSNFSRFPKFRVCASYFPMRAIWVPHNSVVTDAELRDRFKHPPVPSEEVRTVFGQVTRVSRIGPANARGWVRDFIDMHNLEEADQAKVKHG